VVSDLGKFLVSLGLPDTLKCGVCGEDVGIDDLRVPMLPDKTIVMHHSKCERRGNVGQ